MRITTRGRALGSGVLAAAVFSFAICTLAAQTAGERWVGTWATSVVARPQSPPPPAPALPPFMANACPVAAPAGPPVAPPPGQTFAPPPFVHLTNQTLRQVVHTSIGGSRVRVVLSNQHGSAPLTIGAAHLALRDGGSAIHAGSSRALTFSGRSTMTVPAHAIAYSDPVELNLPPMSDLAIDLYLPGTTDTSSPLTFHQAALQTSYVSETGNHAGKAQLPVVGTIQNWMLLSRVEVLASTGVVGLVAFGDSITDGARSTPDSNARWADHLVRRAAAQTGGPRLAIMNAGIGGNRVLSEGPFNAGINALARFEVDALSQPGVTHVIVLEGINDIGQARQNPVPTAEDLIAGHKQLIERAHARGLKIYGATLTPFYGAAYYTETGEAKRQALNAWIRSSKAYDAVIDFDQAIRDRDDPRKMAAAYDSCDHLHPSDAGYKAMAEAIDLALFSASPAR